MHKWDIAVFNPPYQNENDSNNRQAPVYNEFLDAVYPVADITEAITPGRFLFNAGQTPKAWNDKMLNDEHLKVLDYEPESEKIFANTEIKGGIAITIHDNHRIYGKIGAFTVYPEINDVNIKVSQLNKDHAAISSIVSSRGLYRFTKQFFIDFPTAANRLGKGNGNMIGSDIFDRIPEAFHAEKNRSSDVAILGRKNNMRITQYIDSDYVIKNKFLQSYNVCFAKASGKGLFGESLGPIFIAKTGEGVTDTFLSVGIFDNEEDANNLAKYLKTKFARALLSIRKITHNMTKAVWEFAPLQDFTVDSDIDWSQSVADIDKQLYKKYGLSDDEIKFIESHVKEMV